MATASDTLYDAMCRGSDCASGSMASGSISTGSYPSLALVTAFKPWLPCGKYESRFTQ